MMTLEEFCESVRVELASFEAEWKANVIKQPESFPSSIPEGEWWEQFWLHQSVTGDSL